MNPFRAPENLVADNLDKKSLEFRIAHVRYFRTLKQTKFPFLDKKMYYEANEQTLGVGIRRFQQFFNEYEEDKVKVEKKLNPKPKPLRHQNKVECQGSRIRFTNSQKLDFLRQYERAKRNEPGLETKEFCARRPNLNEKTFGRWLQPISRAQIKMIQIDYPKKKQRISCATASKASATTTAATRTAAKEAEN